MLDHADVQPELAKFKVPKRVEFRSEFPKTIVGKVLRRVLVEEELKNMILTAGDLKEKTALLVAAIKFLAVKHRIGPIWGGELDATGSE